jgi:cytochrome P450
MKTIDAAHLDIMDPGFRFDSPEVDEARRRNWFAYTSQGILVLRYAAKEVLRWGTVVRVNMRWALQNFTYKGLRIPADSLVMVCHAAADRDPEVFEQPHRFDVTRRHATAPLAFGRGPHRCVGAAVAQMELTETLQALPQFLEPPQITGPVRWRPPTTTMYGPEHIPVRLQRRLASVN